LETKVGLISTAAKARNALNDASNRTVDELAERYWQYDLQINNYLRSQLGLPIETIRPLTFDAAVADAAFARRILDALEAVDARRIDHDRWLVYRAMQFWSVLYLALCDHFWLAQQATPYAGGTHLSATSTLFTTFEFAAPADGRRYLSLLRQYAEFVRSVRLFLQAQHERGIILADVEISASVAVFRGYTKAAQTECLVPDDARLGFLSDAQRAALKQEAAEVVSSDLVPALHDVAEYLDGPYRTGAPLGVGLWQYARGREYYEHLILANTTLTTTPERLHALGLDQVARLNEQLDEIRGHTGFSGTLKQFKDFLAHDPRFFAKTMEEFGQRLERYVERARAAVPRFFSSTPVAPYGVEPLARALAGSQTFGYYDPPRAARPKGIYYYNAWHPERASTLTAGALICHELIPGHHFQIALQQENSALPNVRRYDFSATGFCEGWGEYAAQLGWEMDVYETAYDKAGRIMQDLMVSARLVVDTGMNVLGWSRERAMQYMREHLTLDEAQIASESLRYSADIPGQALAYKTGELTILEIRDEARQRLGSAFDIRRFHEWMIGSGAMTLDTLRSHVDYEINAIS
jgi:uncharacterized protein (DUF885 family)